jgi:hypothetical protein
MPTSVHTVWRKSSRSSGAQNCVEVAGVADVMAVRDSKAPTGPALRFGVTQWSAFLADIKRGRLDLTGAP